jgi:hypothetical protein
MNSIATPKAIERHDALIVRADEQLAKMEHDCARPPSAGAGLQSSLKRSGFGVLVGLPLAACIVVAALLLQSSHGGEARLVVARSAPQLVSTPSLLPENSQLPAQPAPSAVQVAPAEATRPQATPLAQAAPQQAAPTAPEPVPDQTQLLQTIARGLAKVERDIEELKASQDEMKRELAKVSEQNLSKTSPPPTQQTPASRKPERTVPHARGRTPKQEWYYSDWW